MHLGALAEPQIMLRRSEAEAYLNLGDIQAARRAAAHIPGLILRLKNEEIAWMKVIIGLVILKSWLPSTMPLEIIPELS